MSPGNDFGRECDARPQRFGSAGQAAHALAARFQRGQKPPADVARRAGHQHDPAVRAALRLDRWDLELRRHFQTSIGDMAARRSERSAPSHIRADPPHGIRVRGVTGRAVDGLEPVSDEHYRAGK
jgi:hypothetical protein